MYDIFTTEGALATPFKHATGITNFLGGQPVLKDIDLVVPEDAIVALLGPNGVGKTTLVAFCRH